MDRWYVAYTQAQAEDKACCHLERQGFAVYLPRYVKVRRHARRVEEWAAPLFPRYVFVFMDIARTRWRAILSTVGVCGLVTHGSTPAPVPDGVVEMLRTREKAPGLLPVAAGPQPGEGVTVVRGPLRRLDGVFACARDQDRVTLLLDLLGRTVRVTLPADAVVVAPEGRGAAV